MAVSIRATVRVKDDNTMAVLAKVSGLTDKKMGEFAEEITRKAQENARGLPFVDGTGELADEIGSSRIGKKRYRIETTSGHASYIELGTQYIKGKMPFLWPAYRWAKKRFLGMKGGKWI